MIDIFDAIANEWHHILGYSSLEIIGTVSAVAGVFLIARQNILGWPLGIFWAAISTYLAFFRMESGIGRHSLRHLHPDSDILLDNLGQTGRDH
jgi:hypothetical protein